VAVSPLVATLYTLTASNPAGQTTSATTTVAVIGSGPGSTAAPGTPAYCLVNHTGTFHLILSGVRHGITDPGMLNSYGYNFSSSIPDSASYQELPTGSLLSPNNGALVKTAPDSTVYLIADGQRHGFASASVFLALGLKWSSILAVTAPELNALPLGAIISSGSARHLQGVNITSGGTVYYLGDSFRYPYPSLAVYNSWNLPNNFSTVVRANSADLAVPVGPNVTARSTCGD
jgi:hypothetical protein